MTRGKCDLEGKTLKCRRKRRLACFLAFEDTARAAIPPRDVPPLVTADLTCAIPLTAWAALAVLISKRNPGHTQTPVASPGVCSATRRQPLYCSHARIALAAAGPYRGWAKEARSHSRRSRQRWIASGLSTATGHSEPQRTHRTRRWGAGGPEKGRRRRDGRSNLAPVLGARQPGEDTPKIAKRPVLAMAIRTSSRWARATSSRGTAATTVAAKPTPRPSRPLRRVATTRARSRSSRPGRGRI